MLKLGHATPYSADEFLDLCCRHLSGTRYNQLRHARLVPTGSPVSMVEYEWESWETYVRNYLIKKRWSGSGVPVAEWHRDEVAVFPGVRQQIDDALSEPTPLEQARAVDALRWSRLDDLSALRPFTFGALVAYWLRFQLVAKWAVRSKDRGKENLESLVNAAVQQAEEK